MFARHAILTAMFLAAMPVVAVAQDNAPKTTNPSENKCLHKGPGDTAVMGDCATDDTGSGQSLSKTLSESGGVITPPATGDSGVKMPPAKGNTPVIPPPGTPGGNPEVQPK